jgi:type IX secretion system substrate protein
LNILKINKMKKLLFIALLFIVKQINAQTNVSGGIHSNTTWSLSGSPYIVTDTVVVFPGVILTIQPGVTVKFANNKGIEIRQAQLIAVGTKIDSITFTSNSTTPTPGIWTTINLNGGSLTSKFTYCNFKYGGDALQNNTTNSLVVSHCKVISNINGFDGGGYTSTLDSSYAKNNTGTALIGFASITNSIISKNYNGATNNGYPFSINNCAVDSNSSIGINDHTSIANCFIRHNGVGIYGSGGSGSTRPINNCVINNNQTGIVTQGADLITNCVIDSNSIAGITLYGGWNDSIRNCEIKYNNIGVLDSANNLGGANMITKNYIENNNVGIRLTYPDSISCNRICNNTSYALVYTNNANTNCVKHNYWCTSDSAATEVVIYDGYDNINLGLVSFMPLDSTCYLGTTGISQISTLNSNILIYPNPNNGSFVIESSSATKQAMQVYDVNGRMVLSQSLTPTLSKGEGVSIDASSLNEGVYNISIISNEGVVNKRLVIVR